MRFSLRDLFILLFFVALYLGLFRFIGMGLPTLPLAEQLYFTTALAVVFLHNVFFAWAWLQRPVAEALEDEHQQLRRHVYRHAMDCATYPLLVMGSGALMALLGLCAQFSSWAVIPATIVGFAMAIAYLCMLGSIFELWGTRNFGCPAPEDRALYLVRCSTWFSYLNLLAIWRFLA